MRDPFNRFALRYLAAVVCGLALLLLHSTAQSGLPAAFVPQCPSPWELSKLAFWPLLAAWVLTGRLGRERRTLLQDLPAAVLTPLAFLADILFMVFSHVNGGEATSMVSGTAVILMCAGAFLGFGRDCLERITDYLTDGFLFAIRIFAPVVVIGAFFFLGGEGISTIMGTAETSGIMTDWAVWLAHHAPLNKYMAAALELIVGGLTGLDGSGFSGLPLTGSLAATFGSAVGASVPVLASLGQIAAIFVGGGTIVPWGIIPVAAICGVSPMELARKNFIPVCLGFAAVFILACFLL